MAGAIDLYSGSRSLTGHNGFKVDKDPLQQLSQGLAGAIGGAAEGIGSGLTDVIQALIDTLTGIGGATLVNVAEWVSNLAAGVTLVIEDVINIIKDLLCTIDFGNGPDAFFASIAALTELLGGDFESLVTNLVSLGLAVFGLDFSSVENFYNSVLSFVGDLMNLDFNNGPLAFIQSLVQSLIDGAETVVQALCTAFPIDWTPEGFTGSITTILENLGIGVQQLVENVVNLGLGLFGLNFSSLEAFFQSLVDNIIHLLGDLGTNIIEVLAQVLQFPDLTTLPTLGELSEWVLDTVFGIVPPDRIPVLPIAHLINDTVNLLSNPMFTGSTPFMPGNQGAWILDSAVSQNGIGGSARIDANGAAHNLLSFDLIQVGPGQRFDINCWVKSANLVASTGAITIGVAEYRTTTGSDNPTYRVLSRPDRIGTTEWKEFGGTYNVEIGSPVVALRVHLAVADSAIAGKVWFDNLFAGKLGLLAISWVDGLQDEISAWAIALQELGTQVFDAIADFLNLDQILAALTQITGLSFQPGQFLNSVLVQLSTATGLDFANGPAAFVASFVGLIEVAGQQIGATLEVIVQALQQATGLVFGGTPQQFLTSLLNLFKPLGLDLSSPQALFDSLSGLLQQIGITLQQAIDGVAAAIGLTLAGPAEFLNSLVGAITSHTGVNLLSPQELFNSISAIVDSVTLTLTEVLNWITGITGLDFASGPAAFLSSLIVAIFRATGLNIGNPANFLTSLGTIPFTNVGGVGFANIGATIQGTWDALLQALTGNATTAQPATPALTQEQVAELMATTAANASALAALQAVTQANANNLLASGDDFERTNPNGVNPTTGTQLWQELYDTAAATRGGFYTSGGQAFWKDVGNQPNRARFRRINLDATTFTAYQRIARVTGTSVAEGTLLLAPPATDYIYARVNSSFSQYIYAAYDGDGNVRLGYNLGAGEVQAQASTKPTSKPTAGSTYALECGDAAGLNSYRVTRNNVTVLAWDDLGKVTAPLDANRGWGWGGKAEGRGVGQSTPSSLHSISISEIPPKPTVGSFLHIVRNTATGIAKAAGDQLIPVGTFNDPVRNSPDVTFSAATGNIVIAKPGPYILTCRLDCGADLTASEEWELRLYRVAGGTKTIIARGGQIGAPNGLLASSSGNAVQSTFQFYNEDNNQQYAVGFFSTGPENIIGSSAGDTTWLTVTRGV
jgi:hypothetical protein